MNKENLKELVKNILGEESEYKEFFKKALDKAGKSIPDMSDAEKKAFFNKIDATWDAKGEKKTEGNTFGAERAKAIAKGDDSFKVDGKAFKVTGVDAEDKENAEKFTNESIVNEEKYTVIDPKGNQMGASDKMQATMIAKKKGGEKEGYFVVSNKNALKARRALEKFKGDFTNPKLKDMMADLFYESVNEATLINLKNNSDAQTIAAKSKLSYEDSWNAITSYLVATMGLPKALALVLKLEKEYDKIFSESKINEATTSSAPGEWVAYLSMTRGKKLLNTFNTARGAKQFLSKNVDKLLGGANVESVGIMSKKQWDEREAKYAIEGVNESSNFNGYVSSTDGKTFTLYNSDKKKIKDVSFDDLANKYMKTYIAPKLKDFRDNFDKATSKGKYFQWWKGKLVNVKLTGIDESVKEAVDVKAGGYRLVSKPDEGVKLYYGGKVIATGFYDMDDWYFWMKHSNWKGSDMGFNNPKEIINYFRAKKITTESVNELAKPTIKVVNKLKNEEGIQIVVTKTTDGDTMYGGFVVRGKLQKVIPVGANNSKEGVQKRALQIWDEFGKQLGENINEAKNLQKAKQALIDFNSGKLGEDEMVKTVIKSLGFKFDEYSEEEAGMVLGSLIKKGKIPTDNYVLNNVIDVLEESVNEDIKNRFELAYYKDSLNPNDVIKYMVREPSHEERIEPDKFSDMISHATKVAKSKGMNAVEFFHKGMLVGSIDKKNGYKFEKGKYYKKSPLFVNEGNAFGMAVTKAKKEGLKEFEFNGKMYKVKEGSYEKNEASKKPVVLSGFALVPEKKK
jgi:hypothetical protein